MRQKSIFHTIMIRFKKYSSIENSFDAEFMDKVRAEMPSDLKYVVQEKVHGANTSFLCDGNDVCFAKRTAVLADNEKFYDYEQILAEYRDRVLIKNKNARFAEKKQMKKRNKLFKEPVPYSEELKALVAEVEAYVNANRLANVISHIGEVSFPKDTGKVLGMFCKDTLEDFLKEHGGEYSGLDKCEQKSLNKEVNKLCSIVLTSEYLSKR